MNRHLLRRALRLPQAALKRLVTGLLQLVLLANRPARLARSGFVLPTTVLLVLMVVLTATALTYRSFTRSDMAISQREQQVIANAATPALDRARAKIEFIFNRDNRLPSGLPTGDFLASMMLTQPLPGTVAALPNDPFTLPGETRLDINRDGNLDNAWSFVSDNNNEVITYSILVEDEERANPPVINIQSPLSQAKANALVTRTGPLATTEATLGCANARSEKGWQVVSDGTSSALQKNFQVNVFVPNANDVNRTVESFEFQQSRIANRGNKWAAWFRYDMEIFAFPPFSINGAMHTDSSLMVRNNPGQLTSFMISSNQSCVYSKEASEITVGATSEDGTFQGQIVRGVIFNNQYGGGDTSFHTFRENSTAANPVNVRTLTADGNTGGVFSGDSVDGGAPADVAVNPLVLYTQDRLQHTNRTTWTRVAAWETNPIRTEGRILNKKVPKPFVDDFFRADNRWGPKPRYSDTDTALDVTNPANGVSLGDDIGVIDQVTDPITGLDGYWERQAVEYGLRLVVGERLELGNSRQWNFEPSRPTLNPELIPPVTMPVTPAPKDRLYPPDEALAVGTKIRANEYRQKRALQDNLAAVQGMVVYHHQGPGLMASDGTFPAACVASTAHPGTAQTIASSRTFAQWTNGRVKADFLNGQGTNGWEFQYNTAFDTPGEFSTQVVAAQPLGIALRNLAYFAGDPNGGAPSFPAIQDTNVHPFPHQTMWGDFSPLRRIIEENGLNSAANFDALSPADKATVHSAACTLGLLAYNLQEELNEYEALSSLTGFDNLTSVSGRVNNLLGAMADYIRANTDPGNNFNDGGVTLVQRLTNNNLNRTQWMQNRIYNILRTQLAKRDVTGGIVTTVDGKLILVNPVTNAELIDGTPLKDASDNILFDAEGVIRGVATTPYDGNAATLTYLAGRVDPYLQNTFLNGQTLKTSTALSATLLPVNRDRPLGGFVENNGINLGGASEYFNRVTFTQWKALFPHGTGAIAQVDVDKFEEYARRVNRIYSLVRDRDRGFRAGRPEKNFTSPTNITLAWNSQTGYLVPVEYGVGGSKYTFDLKTNCDPNVFRPVLPTGGGGNSNVGISGLVGCSLQEELPIRNPSLYYLFPLQSHSHLGTGYHAQPDVGDSQQPPEEYITQTYIKNQNSGATRYQPVALAADYDPDPRIQDDKIIRGVKNIAAVPASRTDLTNTWVTPASNVTADTLLPTNVNDINRAFSINICGQQQACFNPATGNLVTANLTGARVSFLDKGMLDGREQMAIRVLDIDLKRLTDTTVVGGTDTWLSDIACDPDLRDCDVFTEGIIYAFREDAVREDEIVRPKTSAANSGACLTVATVTSAACHMVTTPGSEKDPPLTAAGISLKPVDFYADPDRRPYGFRLRNGADMSNGKARSVGMTFVTDNSTYIMGDFNLHSTNGDPDGTPGNLIEEFTDKIGGDVWTENNFYTQRTVAKVDNRFSQPGEDTWRPVEILTDAFTILSRGFLDGAAEDTYIRAKAGNTPLVDNTSYMNQSRPNAAQNVVRANGASASVASASPIFINRNGDSFRDTTAAPITRAPIRTAVAAADWTALTDPQASREGNIRAVRENAFVNAVFIGGVVPNRVEQSNGGLHNFPRLIEDWQGRALQIAGAFFQLNFATGSTGPYEHDAWQPGSAPIAPNVAGDNNHQAIGYYRAPARRWGYDPGLLYYPPAAAARRFISVDTPRSEYFRELPSDDPYIANLRCATQDGGGFVYDAGIRGTCPPPA